MPTTNFVNGTRITAEWLNEVDAAVFSPTDADIYNVRYYGAVLDGTTDDLAAFNAAIAAIPSGGSREYIVDGIAYLSGATSNSGRFPTFKFLAGAGITTTPGGAIGGESSRLSWPVRYSRQLANGPEFISVVTPSTTAGATFGYVRGTYKQFNGNAATLGTTNGVGDRTNYISYAYGSGSDIADYRIGIWRRSALQDGGSGFTQNLVAVSPNVGGASTRTAVVASEMNVTNRYADTGFTAKRGTLTNWTGVLQIVPEDSTFGEGGTAYNTTFGVMIGHSNAVKGDGFYAKQWTGILIEPEAICGDGYAAYWSGNDSGVSSQDPAAAIALAQTWKSGLNLSAATFSTGRAVVLDDAHRLAWLDGVSDAGSIRVATAATAATVAAAGATETTSSGFFQFTRPLLWGDGNYVDRGSVITLRRDLSNPTGVQPMMHIVALGKGDNASVKGVTGAYIYVGDRSDVDATNKGCLYGISSVVVPKVARNNTPYDDITGLLVQHGGLAGTKGTDAMFIGRNTAFLNDDPEWLTGLTCGANVSYAFRNSAAAFVGFNASGRMAGVSGAAYGFLADGEIQTSVTTNAYGIRSELKTAASAAITSLFHFSATRGTIGGGSSVTSQYGYYAAAAMTGATNNYGFLSDLNAASGVWGFYSRGTAQSYFGGNLIQLLAATVTPANNSEMMVQLTSNTQLTFKVKGTDGTVRSANLTLA